MRRTIYVMKYLKNMPRMRALSGSLLAALIVVSLAPFNMGGCAVDQSQITHMVKAGGHVGSAITFDDRREANLGRNVVLSVTNQYGLVADETLNRYVTLVGLTVADASPRTDLEWSFGVVESDEVNAFSGPNGYVMITRGALARMQDESELAGMLGHEIGHIIRHHGREAVKRAEFSGALSEAVQANDKAAQFGQMSDFAVDVVTKQGFSQPEEIEADVEAVKYVARAGYDPNSYLRFLQRMKGERGGGGDLLGTHPGLGARVQRVAEQIARDGTGGKGQALAERFKLNVK